MNVYILVCPSASRVLEKVVSLIDKTCFMNDESEGEDNDGSYLRTLRVPDIYKLLKAEIST